MTILILERSFLLVRSQFETLGRKAVRFIDYQGNNGQGDDRTGGGFEHPADSGYAAGFEALIAYIPSRFPNNEH